MKPYYEKGGIQIFHGDCRELSGLSVDVVLLDPPYGETSLTWDKRIPGLPDFVAPFLKPSGSLWCFGSMRLFLETVRDFDGYNFAQDVIWEKHNGSGFASDRFKRVHEIATHWYPKSAAWADVFKNPIYTPDATARTVRRKERPPHTGEIENSTFIAVDGGPRLMRSVIYQRSCHGYALNETQKPEGIVWPLLDYSCPKGGTVFDPTCGSGTTAIGARALGMKAILCDVREDQCEIAARRLSQEILDFSEVSA